MDAMNIPNLFLQLQTLGCIDESEIKKTSDNFWMIRKSLSDLLAEKNIFDFSDSEGDVLACDRFFDDWFLYAVPCEDDYTYSLLKMREQEYDAEDDTPSDGDIPGITISFISFDCDVLISCLKNPINENTSKLNTEINRVVAYRGQRHHRFLKKYFKNPQSLGSYLVADIYTKIIASCARCGSMDVPKCYKALVQRSLSCKPSSKLSRIPRFIETLNQAAGRVICDNEKIYIENSECLTEYESLAILATHTGNTSIFSFAAEVEYHARFLTPLTKIKIPFLGRSIYDSAIRADMTIEDNEFEGPAPFYKSDSKIVKRQYELHRTLDFNLLSGQV